MKNPFGQIVSFEDYVDIIGIPKEQLNSEEVKNRINKWLVQATEQFDSMISGNGQLGRIYRWFEKLENNEEDNYKKYKLIKAICSWVETFVIKGKFWVDGLPVINSNVDIQINSSSNDSNVEAKRKDIIQDLVSVGLYQTTNFGDNNTFQDNQQNAEQLIEDLIVLSTSELQQNYLKLNPQKSLEGNLDFANNDLVNGGNIIGSTQHARNNIQYYNIIDSTIDLNRNTIIGSLPQDPTTAADIAQINQNIASINQEQITQNTNISNNANEINALKAKDIEQNNRLDQLEQETEDNFNEIANIKTKDQQQDNSIQSNTTSINANTNSINTLNQQVANNKNLLDQTIDGLRTLKPFEYVGEFQQGTSYNINQLVSLNNNLYLSKEDNNNTTPPSDKWLLLNEDFASINLNDYYTKLEVDSIKNNLQNSITSNTTNITNLNNEVVKIAGNQTITGAKTFNNQVIIWKDGTPLALRAVNPGKIYMIMKGADDSANFSLGANSSNTSLEVNRGDLTISTRQANKNVNFENVARIKFNRSVLEMGTEINAGFGGGEVKFIPEDNSTKTLKFYNNNPNDTRRFKLLVPEPTEAQNPATKAYVDNAIANSGGSGGSIDTSNFATLNTDQTISGAKTFSNAITITKTNAALQFKPGTNQSSYLEFYNGNTRIAHFGKGSSSSNNLNLAAQSGQLLIEASQGIVARSPIEFGTEIKAGYGGATVKFLPEDNYTKTLQFYNNSNTDQRRFNLLIPEPTQAQNPATKHYVDTAIAGINTSGNIPQQTLDQINNNTTNITNLTNKVNTNTNSINTLNQKDTQNVKLSGDQTINGTKTFTNQILANGGIKIAASQTITSGNLELGYGSTFAFITSDDNRAKSLKFSGLSGKGKLDLDMGSASKITNLPDPINNQDAATKRYVDTKANYRQVFSNTTTLWSTNQTTIISISNYVNANGDPFRSWMIQFDRYGSNGNNYEGTINLNFLLPDINKATWVEANTYFNSSNQRFQDGGKAGITIHRTSSSQLKLTFQLWDGSNRIKNVKLLAPPA